MERPRFSCAILCRQFLGAAGLFGEPSLPLAAIGRAVVSAGERLFVVMGAFLGAFTSLATGLSFTMLRLGERVVANPKANSRCNTPELI